jgi:hypothetical protein
MLWLSTPAPVVLTLTECAPGRPPAVSPPENSRSSVVPPTLSIRLKVGLPERTGAAPRKLVPAPSSMLRRKLIVYWSVPGLRVAVNTTWPPPSVVPVRVVLP